MPAQGFLIRGPCKVFGHCTPPSPPPPTSSSHLLLSIFIELTWLCDASDAALLMTARYDAMPMQVPRVEQTQLLQGEKCKKNKRIDSCRAFTHSQKIK